MSVFVLLKFVWGVFVNRIVWKWVVDVMRSSFLCSLRKKVVVIVSFVNSFIIW